MAKIKVVETIPSHIFYIKDHLREIDIAECWDTANHTPEDALEAGYFKSELCFTILRYELPVAIFGLVKMNNKLGVPWMLATNELKSIKKYFMEYSADYIDLMLSRCDFLVNYISMYNTDSIKWLEWCGFQLDTPELFGEEQKLFRRFYKGAYNV